MGCRPWGRGESDTTERLHFHFSLSCTGEGNGSPLQCSCLESPRDGGAWWAAAYHRVGHDWRGLAAAAEADKRYIIASFFSSKDGIILSCLHLTLFKIKSNSERVPGPLYFWKTSLGKKIYSTFTWVTLVLPLECVRLCPERRLLFLPEHSTDVRAFYRKAFTFGFLEFKGWLFMSHSLFFPLNVENIISVHIMPKTVEVSSFWRPWKDWMSCTIHYISLFQYVHVHTRMKRKPNLSVKGKHMFKTKVLYFFSADLL